LKTWRAGKNSDFKLGTRTEIILVMQLLQETIPKC